MDPVTPARVAARWRGAHSVTTRWIEARALVPPAKALADFEEMYDFLVKGQAEVKRQRWYLEEVHKAVKANVEIDPEARAYGPTFHREYHATVELVDMVLAKRMKSIGYALFLGIIETYALPDKVRKPIEVASSFWTKFTGRPPRGKDQLDAMFKFLDRYDEYVKVIGKQIVAARQALAVGVEHGTQAPEAQTKVTAGSFTLINGGGFPVERMQGAARHLEKAEALIRSAGFGQVCYGEAVIGNKLNGKAGVAAFYLKDSDQLFVRADGREDDVRVIIHELGHRLHRRFLHGRDHIIESAYETTKTLSRFGIGGAIRLPKDMIPEVGHVYKEGRFTYTVTYADETTIQFVRSDGKTGSFTIASWMSAHGIPNPTGHGFVTQYAGTSAGENFAELFAYYCMGKLAEGHRKDFEKMAGI